VTCKPITDWEQVPFDAPIYSSDVVSEDMYFQLTKSYERISGGGFAVQQTDSVLYKTTYYDYDIEAEVRITQTEFVNELEESSIFADVLKQERHNKFISACKYLFKGLNLGTIYLTDGTNAILAGYKGDTVTVTFYAAKVGLGTISTILGKQTLRIGDFAIKSFGGKVCAVATCIITIAYDLNKLSETTDKICEQYYAEQCSSLVIGLGINLASIVNPYVFVFTATWQITIMVLSAIIPNKLAESVLSSTENTVTFFFVYFCTTQIPSDIAEDAYAYVAGIVCAYAQADRDSGIPAICILPE